MRAHAHWPNVAQTDLNVVVVIIDVVVAKVVAVLRKYRRFLKLWTETQTHRHTVSFIELLRN